MISFILYSLIAAASLQTPGSFEEITEATFDAAWQSVQIKSAQMFTYYVPRPSMSGSSVEFWETRSEIEVCGQTVKTQPIKVGSIHVSRKFESNLSIHTIKYSGCDEKVIFTEVIRSKGQKPIRLEPIDLMIGVRPELLTEGEVERVREVKNPLAGILFRTIQNRNAEGTSTLRFFAIDHDYLTVVNSRTNKIMRVNGLESSIKVSFGLGSYWTSNWPKAHRLYVYRNDGRSNRYYQDSSGGQNEISENSYKTALNELIFNRIKYASGGLLEAFSNYYWPKSEFGPAGGANDTFIDELTLILENIQSDRDKEVTIDFILNFIEAARKSEILDRRKK